MPMLGLATNDYALSVFDVWSMSLSQANVVENFGLNLGLRPGHTVVKNPLQARHDAVEFTPRHDTGCHTAVKCKCVVVKINH